MSVFSLCVPEAKLSGYTACPEGASGPRRPANIGHQISKEAIMPYQWAQGRDEGEDSLNLMYRGVDESFFGSSRAAILKLLWRLCFCLCRRVELIWPKGNLINSKAFILKEICGGRGLEVTPVCTSPFFSLLPVARLSNAFRASRTNTLCQTHTHAKRCLHLLARCPRKGVCARAHVHVWNEGCYCCWVSRFLSCHPACFQGPLQPEEFVFIWFQGPSSHSDTHLVRRKNKTKQKRRKSGVPAVFWLLLSSEYLVISN